MKKRLIIIAIILIITNLFCINHNSENKLEYEQNLQHAETYYWLGMQDHGDMQAFDTALEYLHKIKIPGELDLSQKNRLISKVTTLKQDIINQRDMAHDTFAGVFPLSRLLGETIFYDAGAAGSFEFIDDPDVIAVSNSAEALLENMQEYLKLAPQFGLVFNSIPRNIALENEIRYIFNSHDKFYIHNDMEVAAILSKSQFDSLKADELSPHILTALFKSFTDTHLLTITIIELDIVDDIYFYSLEAKAYKQGDNQHQYSISNLTFCRDKRDAAMPIIWLNLVLVILALLAFNLFKANHEKVLLGKNLFIPLFAFAIGRFLPWVLTPLISTFQPSPEVLVKLSLWWLMLFGLIIICGTMLTYWLISNRLKRMIPALGGEKQLGLSLFSLGLGVSGYLGSLILIYDSSMILSVISVVISISVIGLIFGLALGKLSSTSSRYILFVIIFSAISGPIITQMIPLYHYLLSVIVLIALAALFLSNRKTAKKSVKISEKNFKIETIPEDADALSERALNPVYQKFNSFNKGVSILENGLGNSRILALTGSSGKGKTATARALICKLKSKYADDIVILQGECPNEEVYLNPFAPIQQALGSYVGINLTAAVQNRGKDIDSLLDGLLDTVIPFSSLLIPSGDAEESVVESKEEIHEIIFRSLVKLSKSKRIVFYLDDIQWIDDSSREFLGYLITKLKKQSSIKISLILTSRDDDLVHKLGIDDGSLLTLESLSDKEKMEILNNGLGLEMEFAQLLLKMIGRIQDIRGELFFLLNTIAFLAKEGAFIKQDGGFVLASKYRDIGELPIPGDYSDTVKQQIYSVNEHKGTIACAACLGLEFSAGLLSECLEISRLELLQILDDIEQKTGLIYDVRNSDDIYAFQSSFTLEIIREFMSITNLGPIGNDVPQLIREYHSRVASTLEISGSSVFEISRHYYASGAGNAAKGLEFCIKAARAAAALFQHDNARKYLAMARECADILGKSAELAEEFFLLELKEAHVENFNQKDVADKCLEYLKDKTTISHELRIPLTRCFYESGLSSRDQKYFTLAVEMGKLIVEKEEGMLDKAEAFQLIAISLPPKEADEIILNLEKSRNLLIPLKEENIKAKQLLARVENSLAEKLTYGSKADRKYALQLFEDSIEIKLEFNDKPGLARTYGGLGRLLIEKKDYAEAEKYFLKDLEICREIQDLGGEVKMFSFIAECKMKQNDFDAALEMYGNSYNKANGLNDKLFAARGYIIASGLSIAGKRTDEFGELLISNYEVAFGIWSVFFTEIFKAVKGSALEESGWFQKLSVMQGKKSGKVTKQQIKQ